MQTLTAVMGLFLAGAAWAQDEGYRFDEATQICLNAAGYAGHNPHWKGPCGDFDLSHLDLRGAKFWNAQLTGADFRGSDLHRAGFLAADLRAVDFRGANLEHELLLRADLRDAVWTDAQLESVTRR